MLYRVVLLALCVGAEALQLGPKYVSRPHVARAGIVRAATDLDTLTEEAALALEGDALEAVATDLSIYLFKSPPFQEKLEQPKRRMLALVYEKLGIMGKAESCAREVRCPEARPREHRAARAPAALWSRCPEARIAPRLALRR